MSDELRRAREAAGLTLQEVAERTRIPIKWLEALERGDTAAFPPGPFLAGYTRQYRTLLGLPPTAAPAAPAPRAAPAPVRAAAPPAAQPARPAPAAPPAAEPPADPVGEAHRPEEHTITLTSPVARIRRAGRMGAVGAVLAVAVVAGLWLSRGTAVQGEEGVDIPPDQVLLVTSASGVHATVVADGREVFDAALEPGKQVRFAAHDELAVELGALEGVSLVYNGRTLKPLGAQSRSRRLVFIDDHGG